MKNNYLILLPLLLVLNVTTAFCSTHTVSATNSDFVFSPDSVFAVVGDTIIFSLGSIHSALEVSQATWNIDSNIPNGGFHVNFGGGSVVLTQAKVYYYVCENHYMSGMKGRIFASAAGISTVTTSAASLNVSPNPFTA